uniref:Proteasome alpha-type subunits domain-containing protein n=1 Tax=Paramoeba aestuarina TaxID=180227 RepID=A0A7S4NMN6_9EUKA|mmetsp:Transcript_19735/g.30872  ORF Transcript_19735/g.30872 Transcript_19735/m.30872 type:complete len:241 (+) Transcript_19735:39-761(+)
MFKNIYDSDAATWSPEGRLYQVEYATEAIHQGSTCVAAKSRTHCVICALKRSPQSELCSYQKKTFRISRNIGICVSGIISDARKVSAHMRMEALDHEYLHDTTISAGELMELASEKVHSYTLSASKRPLGMGFVLIGYDQSGGHIYECWPSGVALPCRISAMGVRHQLAKSYLDGCSQMQESSVDDLILTTLQALQASAKDTSLTAESISISVVGRDCDFHDCSEREISHFIDVLNAPPS